MKFPKPEPPTFLNRFTSLPVLLDILRNKHLVMLDPETWEDRNDAFYMERYKAEKKLKTLVALCFSMGRETFHHWKVFSAGISGVCIELDGLRLVPAFENQRIECKSVSYRLVTAVEKAKPKLSDWPYIKRWPYKDENEFRAVYECKAFEAATLPVRIELTWIRQITLSPWMPKPVADSVCAAIKAMPGCDRLKVTRSTLLENSRWKNAITPDLDNT